MGRVAGVDFGDRRIGIAVSDEDRSMAFPKGTIEYRGGVGKAATLVAERVRQLEAGTVVVGLPLRLDGTSGPQADRVRSFVDLLQRALPEGILVATQDERHTSGDARQALMETGGSGRRIKKRVDTVAAAMILQDYLNDRARCTKPRVVEEGTC
jgi:putative Holliday junction resolvase